jgi:hypothetical protein
MTNDSELDTIGRQLASKRPSQAAETQPHVSNLIEQIQNYRFNPEKRDALRPMIFRTIDRLTARQARSGTFSPPLDFDFPGCGTLNLRAR